MENGRKASISAALIVLLCFFLPWVQVSCGASKDTLTGIDLAREGHNGLWLIPFLMVSVIILSVARRWQGRDSGSDISALVSLVAGVVSVYLMNRERLRAEDTSGLIAVRLTGWFWLGLGSSIALTGLAAVRLLRRPKPS
jgi:hypothetical protein